MNGEVSIPRLSETDNFKKTIDIDLLDKMSAHVAELLQKNASPLAAPVLLSVRDIESFLGVRIPDELLELLVSRVSRSGWEVYRHYREGRIDAMDNFPNFDDVDI